MTMDYCEGGSLYDFIVSKSGDSIKDVPTQFI